MDAYLVELYLPRGDGAGVEDAAVRARAASDELASEGKDVRYLQTIFVPQDEICFHLYEAQGADVVGEASRRARIAYERIVGVVSVGARDSSSASDRLERFLSAHHDDRVDVDKEAN